MKKAFFVSGFWLSALLIQAEPVSFLVPTLEIPAKVPAISIPLERVPVKHAVIPDTVPQVALEGAQIKKACWDFFDFRTFA